MNTSAAVKPNLVGASRAELADLVSRLDPRPFRSQQVYHWINRRLAGSVEAMTDLPKDLRRALDERFVLRDPRPLEVRRATDGTAKYAFEYADGVVVEAVVMPMNGRTTLCLSSQAGCAVGCVFCVTGALGSGRNLSGGEIFGQYRVIVREEGLLGEPLNVVFMGMGEPLLNLDSVHRAVELLAETVSPKRVTVSTSGIVPGLRRLAAWPRRPNLAISLNATTQAQREQLMPAAAKWPLDQLMAALRQFPLERGRRITVEYVLLAGINDTEEDAQRLPRLLRGLPVKVNVIPFNPDSRFLPGLSTPDEATIDRFAGVLAAANLNVTVRRSKGLEVAGACGQLRGQIRRDPAAPVGEDRQASSITAPH